VAVQPNSYRNLHDRLIVCANSRFSRRFDRVGKVCRGRISSRRSRQAGQITGHGLKTMKRTLRNSFLPEFLTIARDCGCRQAVHRPAVAQKTPSFCSACNQPASKHSINQNPVLSRGPSLIGGLLAAVLTLGCEGAAALVPASSFFDPVPQTGIKRGGQRGYNCATRI
jgi:hypothetical protein